MATKNLTVGLFGTCGDSKWRDSVIEDLEAAGLDYFNPLKDDWSPEDAVNEAEHMANDRIIVFAITGETFGVASLAELGLSAAQIVTSDRTLIAYVAPECDEKARASTSEPKRYKDSDNARKIVLAHLSEMQKTNMDIILVKDIKDISDTVKQVARLHRSADAVQGMVRYGKDGITILNLAEVDAMVRNSGCLV